MRLIPENQQCLGPETMLSAADTMTGLLSVSTECALSLLNCISVPSTAFVGR